MAQSAEGFSVLPERMAGGPHGLGDPDDRTLRRVESDVIIPKYMKKEAHKACTDYVKAFTECGQKEGLLSFIKCRSEVKAMNNCITQRYSDPAVKEKCTDEYLAQRSEYRRSGLTLKEKMKRKECDMY